MVKRNLVANYVGTAWTAVMGIAFVPIYVKHLGDEAYGVVAIAAAIQAYLSFLDLGLTPLLARELSRFTGGAHSPESIRSLLRAVEVWAWSISVVAMGAIWLAAPWIASDWLRAETLTPETISHALRVLSAVVALRFIESLYRACLVGLQRQVTVNLLSVVFSTSRGLGAAGVLLWWSATLDAFFWWQGAVSLLSAAAYAFCVYATLPRSRVSITSGLKSLRSDRSFAFGMLLSSVLVLAVTNTDKIILARLLSLEEYGKYMVAMVAGSCVPFAVGPIGQACYPRLTQLYARRQMAEFNELFHRAAQSVALICGAFAITLVVFSTAIVQLWTGNSELAEAIGAPMQLLATGNLLNACAVIPYLGRLSKGSVKAANITNLVAVCAIVPALFVVVPRFGMVGAGAAWVCLNTLYVLLFVPLTFARSDRKEFWRWCSRDTALPIIAIATAGVLTQQLIVLIRPQGPGLAGVLTGLMVAGTAGLAVCPEARVAALRPARVLIRMVGMLGCGAGHRGRP